MDRAVAEGQWRERVRRHEAWLQVTPTMGCLVGGGFLRVLRAGELYPWGEIRTEDADVCTFDVRSRDRAHWQSLRLFLTWIGGEAWARIAYKVLRRTHFEGQAKEWSDVLPPEIVRWASETLDRAAKGLDCVDNYRVARMGNTGQVRRYKRQKDGGCCGFSDTVAVGPDGNKYMLGFNYGH